MDNEGEEYQNEGFALFLEEEEEESSEKDQKNEEKSDKRDDNEDNDDFSNKKDNADSKGEPRAYEVMMRMERSGEEGKMMVKEIVKAVEQSIVSEETNNDDKVENEENEENSHLDFNIVCLLVSESNHHSNNVESDLMEKERSFDERSNKGEDDNLETKCNYDFNQVSDEQNSSVNTNGMEQEELSNEGSACNEYSTEHVESDVNSEEENAVIDNNNEEESNDKGDEDNKEESVRTPEENNNVEYNNEVHNDNTYDDEKIGKKISEKCGNDYGNKDEVEVGKGEKENLLRNENEGNNDEYNIQIQEKTNTEDTDTEENANKIESENKEREQSKEIDEHKAEDNKNANETEENHVNNSGTTEDNSDNSKEESSAERSDEDNVNNKAVEINKGEEQSITVVEKINNKREESKGNETEGNNKAVENKRRRRKRALKNNRTEEERNDKGEKSKMHKSKESNLTNNKKGGSSAQKGCHESSKLQKKIKARFPKIPSKRTKRRERRRMSSTSEDSEPDADSNLSQRCILSSRRSSERVAVARSRKDMEELIRRESAVELQIWHDRDIPEMISLAEMKTRRREDSMKSAVTTKSVTKGGSLAFEKATPGWNLSDLASWISVQRSHQDIRAKYHLTMSKLFDRKSNSGKEMASTASSLKRRLPHIDIINVKRRNLEVKEWWSLGKNTKKDNNTTNEVDKEHSNLLDKSKKPVIVLRRLTANEISLALNPPKQSDESVSEVSQESANLASANSTESIASNEAVMMPNIEAEIGQSASEITANLISSNALDTWDPKIDDLITETSSESLSTALESATEKLIDPSSLMASSHDYVITAQGEVITSSYNQLELDPIFTPLPDNSGQKSLNEMMYPRISDFMKPILHPMTANMSEVTLDNSASFIHNNLASESTSYVTVQPDDLITPVTLESSLIDEDALILGKNLSSELNQNPKFGLASEGRSVAAVKPFSDITNTLLHNISTENNYNDYNENESETNGEKDKCGCNISGSNEGPIYTQLGYGRTLAEVRSRMEQLSGLNGRAIRVEKVVHCPKGSKTKQGCPVAKYVIQRSSMEEKLLVVAKQQVGHNCEHTWIIIAIVVWQGLNVFRADHAYEKVSHILGNFGQSVDRQCSTNRRRDCACQGLDRRQMGSSFSFGCSWSVYNNGCKFAKGDYRASRARKFRLRQGGEHQEPQLEQILSNVADDMGRILNRLVPEAAMNMTRASEAARMCRIGSEEARSKPFSGVTAVSDFCAHEHTDFNNVVNGCTAVLTLLRPEDRLGPIAEQPDQQLHVLPYYRPSDTDEFDSEEGQDEKRDRGEIWTLHRFERELRVRASPSRGRVFGPNRGEREGSLELSSVSMSDCDENFADDRIGGLALALTHGSVLLECAREERHATTALRRPNRRRPARLGLVFYQHKNMDKPDHGHHKHVRKCKSLYNNVAKPEPIAHERREEMSFVDFLDAQDNVNQANNNAFLRSINDPNKSFNNLLVGENSAPFYNNPFSG